MIKLSALNNDTLAALFIQTDGPIEGNLGWAVTRTDKASGVATVLHSHIPFSGEDNSNWQFKPTTVWPFQANIIFDDTVEIGHSYSYSIQAMGGSPDDLKPIAGAAAASNEIVVDIKVTKYIVAAFTRLLSTQWTARNCPRAADGSYDFDAFKKLLATPGNPLREHLMGYVKQVLQGPALRAAKSGGHVYAALYEFTDAEMIDFFIEYMKQISLILGNAGKNNEENLPTLAKLNQAKFDVLSRVVPPTSTAHNKSQSEVDSAGHGVSYTCGAVNVTTSGMTQQASNIITIFSRELAEQTVEYWKQLQKDTQDNGSKQGQELRSWCAVQQPLVKLPDGTTVQFWASPNMKEEVKPKQNPPTPPTMALLNQVVDDTDELGICLQFIPGYPSVLSKIAEVYPDKPDTVFLVAVSSPEAIPYNPPKTREGDAPLFVAACPLEKQVGDLEPVFDILPHAFAIIHSKYYAKNPLSPNCVVETGSGNDGFKECFQNDDDHVFVSGCPRLGMYYMVNGMFTYMHYLGLQGLNDGKGSFQAALVTNDSWQGGYLTGWQAKVITYVHKYPYPAPDTAAEDGQADSSTGHVEPKPTDKPVKTTGKPSKPTRKPVKTTRKPVKTTGKQGGSKKS